MNWFVILVLVILYLVIGGMVLSLARKLEINEFELDFLPPIVFIIFWPIFVVIGVVILIVYGSAALGGWLMDQIIEKFNEKKPEQ